MKLLTKSENDVNICVEQFRTLITKEISANEMFECLDEIMSEYSRYLVEYGGIYGNEPSKVESAKLYNLKLIRNVFAKIEES